MNSNLVRVFKLSPPGGCLRNERGVVLIITLFVVALVTILVLEYHFDAIVEIDLAANYGDDVRVYYLALSGLNFARAVLQQDDQGVDGPEDLWYRLGLVPACFPPQQLIGFAESAAVGTEAGESGEVALADEPPAETPTSDEGCVSLRITDETGKLPINALRPTTDDEEAQPDQDWLHIFERFFETFEIDPVIVDALVDWLDRDDSPRGPGGAESSYYAGLTPPYTAANGPMHTPGELRLVMGFHAETLVKLFPGTTLDTVADADMGSNSYLTPYGVDLNESGENPDATAKVNLNTAIPEVLQALIEGLQDGGNADTAVEEILAQRNEKQFETLNEVCTLLTDNALCSKLNKVADVKSAYFRIESIGRLGPIQKTAVAVIQRRQDTTPLLYFKVE